MFWGILKQLVNFERMILMKKMKKLLSVGMAALMLVSSMGTAALAADTNEFNNVAVLDPASGPSARLFNNYVVYSDANWIIKNGVGVGAEGWTDLDYEDTGLDMYHYSNIVCYLNNQDYPSGRTWGYGRVHVSTGDLGMGAMRSYQLFYGTN